MAEIMYWEAIRRAHDEEMANDKLVIAMGEDIGVAGGTYKATSGLFDKYGPERIIDTPISESAIIGELIGELNASHTGARYRPRDRDGSRTASLGLLYDLADFRFRHRAVSVTISNHIDLHIENHES